MVENQHHIIRTLFVSTSTPPSSSRSQQIAETRAHLNLATYLRFRPGKLKINPILDSIRSRIGHEKNKKKNNQPLLRCHNLSFYYFLVSYRDSYQQQCYCRPPLSLFLFKDIKFTAATRHESMIQASSCAAYVLQYSAAMLLCHVCAEDGGGGRDSLLAARRTPEGFITDGGGAGVDGGAGRRKRDRWCAEG